jgi:hypothetical protein
LLLFAFATDYLLLPQPATRVRRAPARTFV